MERLIRLIETFVSVENRGGHSNRMVQNCGKTRGRERNCGLRMKAGCHGSHVLDMPPHFHLLSDWFSFLLVKLMMMTNDAYEGRFQ